MIAQGRTVTAGGLGFDDFFVEQRQVIGQAIDLGAHGRALCMQGIELAVDAAVEAIETLAQVAHFIQYLLTLRYVAGAVAGGAQGCIKVIQTGADV